MRHNSLLRCALVLLACTRLEAGQPAPGKVTEHSFEVSAKQTVPYLFSLPKEFEPSSKKKWPVILFLHGRGESRGPLSIVAKWGPPRMAQRGDNLPYILIAPQCPAESRWTDDDQQAGILKLLDHITTTFPADTTRIYLTGLSMGGYGTWKRNMHPRGTPWLIMLHCGSCTWILLHCESCYVRNPATFGILLR